MKKGFDADLYLQLQTEKIIERVRQFDKLYLEVGGKIVDDLHAARVLPGFDPQAKIKVLQNLADRLEVVICVSAINLLGNKTRGDSGLNYFQETVRMIDFFRQQDFLVKNLVITLCDQEDLVAEFVKRFKQYDLAVYIHNKTDGYPFDLAKVVSSDGYGKNSFIKTERQIVVVTAPGPASGKMATCLSQIYHEFLAGRKVGYAKYETFPVWDLAVDHPVNLAYEAATLDLMDKNLIDPFHLEAYGVEAVNYNRDIETFPVLKEIFQRIYGQEIYKSPTDMGVNMVAKAITNMSLVEKAAQEEIVRRYQKTQTDHNLGKISQVSVNKAEQLVNKVNCFI